MRTSEKWNSASLRVFSDSMSAEQISTALHTAPSESFEKGTRMSQRNDKSAIRTHSIWILDSGCPSSEPLEEHLRKLAAFIEQNLATFQDLMSKCKMDIFCGFSSEGEQGGFVLDTALLKRIARVNVDLVFDLYPLSGESGAGGKTGSRDL